MLLFSSELLLCLDFTNHLGHCTHRTEAAPGSGFEQNIHRKPNDGGCQHQAVEAKAELGDPIRYSTRGVSPPPRNTKQPQQFDCFAQGIGSGRHQISLENHISEHTEKEHQKSIPEPLGRKPLGRRPVSRTLAAFSEKLTSATVAVAKRFIAANDRDKQRHQEIDHTQPRKENVEKSQSKVDDGPDP